MHQWAIPALLFLLAMTSLSHGCIASALTEEEEAADGRGENVEGAQAASRRGLSATGANVQLELSIP